MQSAVVYIGDLKREIDGMVENRAKEKMVTDQAIAELQATIEQLKRELKNAWKESSTFKQQTQVEGTSNRITNIDEEPDGYEDGSAEGESE